MRKIETNDTKTQKIITRYVLKSDLKTNLKHTNEISKGKGRPYKTYSYYYVLCLNAIFKESSTKTIDQQIQDKLDKALLTPKEIDNIFHKYLGNDYDKINHYDLEDLSTAIYNRQRRLKSAIPKIVDTYKEYIGLKKYLFNVNNAKDYVNALRILIKMADSHEIYDSDVVRLADQLNHKNPNSVISYAKKLAKNHLELKKKKHFMSVSHHEVLLSLINKLTKKISFKIMIILSRMLNAQSSMLIHWIWKNIYY